MHLRDLVYQALKKSGLFRPQAYNWCATSRHDRRFVCSG